MDEQLQWTLDEANRLLSERKYDEIIPLVQPILIRDTGGLAQRVYGMALLGQGRYQEAVNLLMNAAQALPNDVTVAFAYGNAMNQNGQVEGARASFERALGIDPNHPGARQGFATTSRALADRDEASEPMKAIEWLYAVWQRDTGNAELANRILDIYIRNGWSDSARQFVDLLPPQLKNSQPVIEKIKDLPVAAPPIDTTKIAPPSGPSSPGPVMETCPFCKQQMMVGVHTCPHCKMVIRARSMPGADYKPDWQEVALNILCWVGMVLGGVQALAIFIAGAQATPFGALGLVISVVQIFANLFILQRNDFWMHISKWLYTISAIRCLLCSLQNMSGLSASFGREKDAAILGLVILFVMGIYSAFMAYLLNHEGAD